MNRKERRRLARHAGKNNAEAVGEKVAQFHKLPQSCSACAEIFDKRDKDMVQSWSVVVRQETVRLFCPECLHKTKEVLDEHTPPKS